MIGEIKHTVTLTAKRVYILYIKRSIWAFLLKINLGYLSE